MTLASMTGFSRASGQLEPYRWTWEAKSVNGRSLDIRVRVPGGLDRIELPAKQRAARKLGRGSISLTLGIETDRSSANLQINREFVERMIELHGDLADRVAPDLLRLDTLLTVRGVVETAEEGESEMLTEQRESAIMSTLDTALDGLIDSRNSEGARLESIIVGHLDTLEGLCLEAQNSDASRLEVIQGRLQRQVTELLEKPAALAEERLAQEIAILVTKADVREEIDRLTGHCAAGRELLREMDPVGRKLDFLCQEFNREANTLCSKSTSEELTRIGLEMKAVIDQFREQAQNVE